MLAAYVSVKPAISNRALLAVTVAGRELPPERTSITAQLLYDIAAVSNWPRIIYEKAGSAHCSVVFID